MRYRSEVRAPKSFALFMIFFLFIGLNAEAEEGRGILPESQPGFAKTPEAAAYQALCPTVFIEGLGDLQLGDMEKRLLCGDTREDVVGRSWSQIPPNQAAFFAKGFLQAKGRHQPRFVQDATKLFINPGPVARLKEFRIMGGPSTWEPPRRRLIRGRELTPRLLDELQGWALNQIKNEGHACAEAETRADPGTGEVVVYLKPGEVKRIIALEEAGDTGLHESTLDRYNAFQLDDIYRDYKITLTRRRTVDDGFLQALVLSSRCEPNGVAIVRDVVLGPSRQIRLGIGASTEEGARVRVIARQTRIGEQASWAQARLNASFRRQVADTSFRWYYTRGEPRWFIEPQLLYEHQLEEAFEAQAIEAKVLHGQAWNVYDGRIEFRAGPNVLSSFLSRGTGPSKTTVFIGEGNLRWMSHDFEYWGTSPRSGSYVEGSVLLTQEDWGANFTAQKIELQGQKLWNIFRFDPPLLVVGFRFNLSSVFSSNENVTTDLPIRFLTFAGGEEDLRGFSRRSLPRDGIGALSGAVGSLEGRLHKVIFERADFLVFTDLGMLGEANFNLRRPIFASPGFGFRWESPIGVFRAYAAQSVALEQPSDEAPYQRDWRFGLTYGEEF